MRIREMLMATVGMAAANGAEFGRPVVTVRVFDKAGIPAQTLREASSEAQRVYREAGIETRWLLCAASDAEEVQDQDADCRRPVAPGEFSVGLVPASMGGRMPVSDSAFGLALPSLDGRPASHAFVLYGRVEKMAGEAHCPSPKLLGVVMAHEVGHLLLGRAHAPRGLMSARWDRRALGEIARGLLLFGGDEPQRLQGAAGQILPAAK